MKRIYFLLVLFLCIAQASPAQNTNKMVPGTISVSMMDDRPDTQFDVSINTKEFRNASLRGTLLQLTSFGAFMWLTDENVWLSYGLSVLVTASYSIIDDPDNMSKHLGHIAVPAIIGVSIAIPLADLKKKMPYRILNY